MRKERVKIDPHVHSRFSSKDSVAPVYQIEEERIRKELDWVAVVDHNTIAETARDLKEISGFPFILGEEILTLDKNYSDKRIEVVGLFLQEPISRGMTMTETIYQIGAQGGIVVIPHLFEEWRHGAGKSGSRDIINQCLVQKIPVAIEILNARARAPKYNRWAVEFWRNEFAGEGVLATAGSDAHRIAEIGRAYVAVPPWETKEEFLEALEQARIVGNDFGANWQRFLNRVEVVIGKSFQDLAAQISEFGVDRGRP